jgi:hypothetical protein
MYEINTNQARTDLFGVNKGLAQVLDNSVYQDIGKQLRAQEFEQQQAEARQMASAQKAIDSEVNNLGDEVFFRDQPMFVKRQNEIADYVKKNAVALKNGDTNAQQEFNNMLNSFHSDAKISNEAGKQWYASKRMAQEAQNQGKVFRPESLQALEDFAKPEYAGDWDVSKVNPKLNFNYSDHVEKNLIPLAGKLAEHNSTRGYKRVTPEEAGEIIKTDLEDANKADQMAYDFQNAEDKLGAKDYIDYAIKKYSPYLTVDVKPQLSEWEVYGQSGQKPPKVAGTYVKGPNGKDSFQFEYTNTQDNPYITIPDPNKRGAVLEVKPYKVEFGGETPVLKALTKPTGEGENKVEGKEITLDYNNVSNIMNNKFGIKNVYDLQSPESTPEHVTVKRTDVTQGSITPAQFNTQWATLKKGQSLVGPDGKTYTKK